MIQFDPTVSLGSLLQLLGSVALLFYIGRWVGRVESRLRAVEDQTPQIRKQIEDGDAAIRALVQLIAEKAR